MKKFKVGCGLFMMIAIIGLVVNPAFSAVVPIGSNITINAYAKWSSVPTPLIDIQSDSDLQTTTIGPLSASATAYVTDGSGNSYETSVDINASWNNAASGSVSIVGNLDLTSSDSSASFTGNFYSGGPNIWSYTFTPDVDGSIVLDWDQLYTLSLDYDPYTVISSSVSAIQHMNSSGNWALLSSLDPHPLIIQDIYGGVPFTFGLGWNTQAGLGLGGQGDMTLHFEGDYDWQFVPTAIPLPGALWLLGSGLIGIVGIRRKYRN